MDYWKSQSRPPKNGYIHTKSHVKHTKLLGGWTNPSEKFAPQIGSFPRIENKKSLSCHHPKNVLFSAFWTWLPVSQHSPAELLDKSHCDRNHSSSAQRSSHDSLGSTTHSANSRLQLNFLQSHHEDRWHFVIVIWPFHSLQYHDPPSTRWLLLCPWQVSCACKCA